VRPGAGLKHRLKVGTVLVREHQGERHIVTVVPDGFAWQETTYASLSSIARAITGTAWSGPRFFGLRGIGEQEEQNDRAQLRSGRKCGMEPTPASGARTEQRRRSPGRGA
jgi:hypothetical protein